jgi:hypothetical protein
MTLIVTNTKSKTRCLTFYSLPRFLLVPPHFLHSDQIGLCIISFHLAMFLKHFDERFPNCLWHFTRRPADVHYSVQVGERVVHALTLLADEVLDVDFLALWTQSVSVSWTVRAKDIPDLSKTQQKLPRERL